MRIGYVPFFWSYATVAGSDAVGLHASNVGMDIVVNTIAMILYGFIYFKCSLNSVFPGEISSALYATLF